MPLRYSHMKKLLKKILLIGRKESSAKKRRKALEAKAVAGAQKAVKEYRRVFERLAEYDRT